MAKGRRTLLDGLCRRSSGPESTAPILRRKKHAYVSSTLALDRLAHQAPTRQLLLQDLSLIVRRMAVAEPFIARGQLRSTPLDLSTVSLRARQIGDCFFVAALSDAQSRNWHEMYAFSYRRIIEPEVSSTQRCPPGSNDAACATRTGLRYRGADPRGLMAAKGHPSQKDDLKWHYSPCPEFRFLQPPGYSILYASLMEEALAARDPDFLRRENARQVGQCCQEQSATAESLPGAGATSRHAERRKLAMASGGRLNRRNASGSPNRPGLDRARRHG